MAHLPSWEVGVLGASHAVLIMAAGRSHSVLGFQENKGDIGGILEMVGNHLESIN